MKNPLRFYWEKICSIHYSHFSVEKHVPFQVLKDFSVESQEANPSTFLSKLSSEIYLSQIINYWGSIFTLYLTWGAFTVVCVLSVFFSFFVLFFLFLSVFSFIDTKYSQDYREGRGNPCFLAFHFHPLTKIHLVHRDFYHFLLINHFVINRLIADETCPP